MDRMTERTTDGSYIIKCNEKNHIAVSYIGYPDGAFFGSVIDRLAAYEDAEEQGLLARLPCKEGDTVYMICFNPYHIGTTIAGEIGWIVRNMMSDHPLVFATYEQAEAALKEVQKDG